MQRRQKLKDQKSQYYLDSSSKISSDSKKKVMNHSGRRILILQLNSSRNLLMDILVVVMTLCTHRLSLQLKHQNANLLPFQLQIIAKFMLLLVKQSLHKPSAEQQEKVCLSLRQVMLWLTQRLNLFIIHNDRKEILWLSSTQSSQLVFFLIIRKRCWEHYAAMKHDKSVRC